MVTKHWNDPVHPGEILADELEYIGMTASELAGKIGVPKNRLYQIINGTRSITADTALRLAAFFKTSAGIWMNLQKSYELDVVAKEIGNSLKKITPYDSKTSHSSQLF